MSNRNNYLPSINAWSNPNFKGNLSIVGNLGVGGNSIFTGTSTFLGAITLPTLSPLKYQEITIFVPTIVSATAAICVSTAQIAGMIDTISVVTNAVTTVGPATFTCSILNEGVETLITNGICSVATGDAAFIPNTRSPVSQNSILRGKVIKVVVGGTNTASGTAHITFRVQVA